MPIYLKQNVYDELVKVSEEILLSCEVQSGMFPSLESIYEFQRCDEILSKHGDTRKYLSKIVDENPFQEFSYEWLVRRLYKYGKYEPKNPPISLCEMEGFSDLHLVAVELVEALRDLPRRYKFTLQLPSTLDEIIPGEVDSFDISERIRLVRVSDRLKEDFAVTNSNGSAYDDIVTTDSNTLLALSRHTNKGQVCLQYEDEGYVGFLNPLAITRRVDIALRTFLGAALAVQFLEKFSYANVGAKPEHIHVHQYADDKWVYSTTETIKGDLSDAMSHLVLNSYRGGHRNSGQWCTGKLRLLQTCFSDHEGAESIRRASQWLFDSYAGGNQLLSFVQATICMEILFGTGDKDFTQGLVNIMKNRCAYLIGTSHQNRRMVMSDFEKIYRVRSKIVHSGKNELSREEANMLYTLRAFCHQSIAAEIKLISADRQGALGALYALGAAQDQHRK